MAVPALIGIDIGTTAVKAVLIGADGSRIAGYERVHPTDRPRAGWVEQSPADWLARVHDCLGQFAGTEAQIAGIGITGQVNTHVFASADLSPLRPAIAWQDGRAAEQAAAIDGSVSAAEKLAWFGAMMPIDASHALSRMAWVAASEPQVWAATAHVMAPKDWVVASLTKAVVADPVASVGLVGQDLAYVAPLLARVPGAAGRLAPLADPLAVAGRVTGGPLTGVPVTVGTMDAWAAMFGVGVAAEGEAMYLSGTSEVLGLISARRVPVPGAIVFPEWQGLVLHAGPTQAGGAALDWVSRLLGLPLEALAACAADIAETAPLFLPHLAGERAPLWDPVARGAFAGLGTETGPPELVAAVMEGVAFSARLVLETLEVSGARRVARLAAGGGGMRSEAWCQIRADALGRNIVRMRSLEAGAVGAAVGAGVACGLLPSLAAAARTLVREDRVFTPRRRNAARAERRYALWRELYAQLRPINAGLALSP